MAQMNDIVSRFAIHGTVKDVCPLGNGLINTTYRVNTVEADAPDYVLQNVNNAIFPDVDLLMNNIVAVTSHIRHGLEVKGTTDIDRKVLTFIPLKDDASKYYYFDGEKYWRIMVFIKDTTTQTAVTPETSRIVGETFGNFQASLADLPQHLGETIVNFHNIEFRLQQLADAVEADAVGRVKLVHPLLDEIQKRAEHMCLSEELHRQGKLPKRICHCDTKVDNILFDSDGSVLCVIDLDTVMPSYVFSDYGDFLRSAANFVAEDDPHYDRVGFNMEIFRAFTEGYLKSARVFLTPVEIENLPYAAALFPYMQLVRFLMDYINGDTYFKTQYPEHNLVRATNQYYLLKSVEAHTPEMQAFIKEQLEK